MDALPFLAAVAGGLALTFAASKRHESAAAAERAAGTERVAVVEAARATTSKVYVPGRPESEVTFYPLQHMRDLFPSMAAKLESPLVRRPWPKNPNYIEEGDYTLGAQPIYAPDAVTKRPTSLSSACSSSSSSSAGAATGGAGTDAAGVPASATSVRHLKRFPSSSSIDKSGVDMKEVTTVTETFSPKGTALVQTVTHTPGHLRAFPTAGPSKTLLYDPATVKVAVATCGGLCPGLNTVIREIVMCLTYVYHVPRGNVFGVTDGYRGFYGGDECWRVLQPENVSRIHTMGGTILGSSRGGMDVEKILAALVARGINIVVLIGGDGTHRGADLLQSTAAKKGVPITVACVPKTIDNDIGIIDRSFGFQTAVEQAVPIIDCAHTEAHSAPSGVGLVKLMGREAGFIALYAALASRDANVCLIPEAPWRLPTLLAYLEERLTRSTHAVIVVAEGAESIETKEAKEAAARAALASGGAAASKTDESGNRILDDVGEYLKKEINAHFKAKGKAINLKYIEPSYLIRSAPANAADSDLCAQLAFNVVHGAMAGHTGFSVGTVDGVCVWIPIWAITTSKPRRVDPLSRLYARLCSSTGQPNLEEEH